MKKILKSFILSLGIVCSDIMYFEYDCITDEHWPRFLGFPFVQSTDTTWLFSMSGELFLSGLIANILVWILPIYVLFSFFEKPKIKAFKIMSRVFLMMLLGASLFMSIVFFTVIDWRLKWHHDNFKLHYYQQDLECNRVFHFFD